MLGKPNNSVFRVKEAFYRKVVTMQILRSVSDTNFSSSQLISISNGIGDTVIKLFRRTLLSKLWLPPARRLNYVFFLVDVSETGMKSQYLLLSNLFITPWSHMLQFSNKSETKNFLGTNGLIIKLRKQFK